MEQGQCDDEYGFFFQNYPAPKIEKLTRPPLKIDYDEFEEKKKEISKNKLISRSSFGVVKEKHKIMNYEPLTDLQVSVKNYQSHAEKLKYYELLDAAAEQTDKCERLAYIATYIITTCFPQHKYRKLFKLISSLGETFEHVDYDKQVLFFCQKVSVEPHIIACNVQGKKWELSYDNNLSAVEKVYVWFLKNRKLSTPVTRL
ncbi:Oxysterol-binding protein-related protein 3 [Thelohanellus kitauei]|uniref:Oxysterol-binding protein-related protein 3 n=1 Tax=Thelohanellus kitauei TaxID=669202 RepID=A0A0C2JRV5_THEKT|nr:Oxysterol-binding protein-related protein 3 [Thelohanellus kitauei]